MSYRYPEKSNQSSAMGETLVVVANEAKLFSVFGTYSQATKFYIQIFDAAAVPSASAVPKAVITMRGDLSNADNWSFDFGTYGLPFENGIVIVASSTLATYTALGSNALWINAVYQ